MRSQLETTPPYSGADMVADANDAFQTIATDFAGATDPAAMAWPYATWADTGNGLLKRRNAANMDWVVEAPLLARSAFAATHSGSGQSIPASTYTKINLSVAYYDYNSEFNTSNSRFTAKIDGVYHFDATANISAASQVENVISIYKNGVEHLWTSVPSSTLHLRSSPMCSGDIVLSVGDYVEMYAFSSVAGSTASQVSRTWLSGHLVRAL